MRIITGKFRGRQIDTVRDAGVRPATDRVKSSIFNMLQNRLGLNGIRVLDLFAGSGSLAFEALSRGAAEAVFVDVNSRIVAALEATGEKLGCEDSCSIVQADALAFVGTETGQYELIFADPPYSYEETPRLPLLIFQQKLLKTDGILIIEHDKHTHFEPSDQYECSVRKEFGNTQISFFVHPSKQGVNP